MPERNPKTDYTLSQSHFILQCWLFLLLPVGLCIEFFTLICDSANHRNRVLKVICEFMSLSRPDFDHFPVAVGKTLILKVQIFRSREDDRPGMTTKIVRKISFPSNFKNFAGLEMIFVS